ncbi:MAG: DUF3313 domain-containing protein [Motiliproteus sp.]
MKKKISVIGLGLALLVLSGCNSSTPVKTQGFLGDYSHFEEKEWSDGAKVKLHTGTTKLESLARYSKVMLLPPEIWHGEGSAYQDVDADEMKFVSGAFVAKVQEAFDADVQFVDQAGPGVITVRTAITGVERMYPERSGWGYIPIALLVEAGKGATNKAQGEETIVYRVSLEAEVYDSLNGGLLISMTDQRTTEKREVATGEKRIEDVEQVMTYWGQRFRSNWDQAHGES